MKKMPRLKRTRTTTKTLQRRIMFKRLHLKIAQRRQRFMQLSNPLPNPAC